jgi:hypothetical protein
MSLNFTNGFNNKIRGLRQSLRGWAEHKSGILKKEGNTKLSSIIAEIDKRAKIRPLSDQEIKLKSQ